MQPRSLPLSILITGFDDPGLTTDAATAHSEDGLVVLGRALLAASIPLPRSGPLNRLRLT